MYEFASDCDRRHVHQSGSSDNYIASDMFFGLLLSPRYKSLVMLLFFITFITLLQEEITVKVTCSPLL